MAKEVTLTQDILHRLDIPNKENVLIPRSFSFSNEQKEITKIGEKLFYYNSDLKSIRLPNSVQVIAKCAFQSCHNLKTINFPQNLHTIEDSAFSACQSFKKLTLPKNLSYLGKEAFAYCRNLEEVTILGIDFMNNGVFSNCSKLKKLNLPETLKTLKLGTIYFCESMEEFIVPASIVKFDQLCIANNTNLKKLVIQSSLAGFENQAFFQNPKLEEVHFMGRVYTNPKDFNRLVRSIGLADGDVWC